MTTWTFWSVCYATGLFILAGIAEIGGGWLVWQNVRGSKPWWWSVFGALALVIYGFIPTFQHLDDFGRLYAVYGGFFIGLAFVWSYYFDGFMPGQYFTIGTTVNVISYQLHVFLFDYGILYLMFCHAVNPFHFTESHADTVNQSL